MDKIATDTAYRSVRHGQIQPMEPSDPIIDELHAIREAIAAASDNDIRTIAEAARAREKEGGAEVVNLPPKLVAKKKAS